MEIDISIMNFVATYRDLGMAKFWLVLTYIANWQIILTFSIIIAFLLALLKEKRKFIFFVSSVLAGEIIYTSLKTILHRARPDKIFALISHGGYSFPSGHATMSVIFYGLISYYLFTVFKKRWQKISVIAIFFTLILAIGFSRIFLGLHWASDIIAGWFLGFSILIFTLTFFRKKEKKTSNS